MLERCVDTCWHQLAPSGTHDLFCLIKRIYNTTTKLYTVIIIAIIVSLFSFIFVIILYIIISYIIIILIIMDLTSAFCDAKKPRTAG